MVPKSARGFSMSARVHPSFLPRLRHAHRAPFRWFKHILAVSVIVTALKLYQDKSAERLSIDMLATERDLAEQQRRNNELLDMYGDRSSLAELEKAIQYYEKK